MAARILKRLPPEAAHETMSADMKPDGGAQARAHAGQEARHAARAPWPKTGAALGQNIVMRRLGADFIGEAFETEFGKTRKRHTLHAAHAYARPEGAPPAFEAFFERVGALRHPCLVAYYARGVDAGFEWMRSEPRAGALESVTTSADLIVEQDDGDGDEDGDLPEPPLQLNFPTLQALLDATEGAISPQDACRAAGDVSEAVEFLRVNGLAAGPLTPAAIMLDKVYHKAEFVARLRYYGLDGDGTDAAGFQKTAHAFAALLRTLADAAHGAHADKTAAAFRIFAADLDGGGADPGEGFHPAFCDLLDSIGATRQNRIEPPRAEESGGAEDAEGAEDGGEGRAAASESPRRVRRVRRQDPLSTRNSLLPSGLHRAVISLLSVLFMLGVVVALVFAIGKGVEYFEESAREVLKMTGDGTFSPVMIVGADGRARPVDALPPNIMDYTTDQMQLAAPTNPVAAMRLLAWQLEFEPSRTNSIRARVAEIGKQSEKFDEAAAHDPAAAYLRGYSHLLGVGGPAADDFDRSRRERIGMEWLENAAKKGFAEAHILMGDWLAGPFTANDPENDRAAMLHWCEIFANQTWTQAHHDAIARINWFARRNRGVKKEDPEVSKIISGVAQIGDIGTMLAMAQLYDQGIVFEESPAKAIQQLRRIVTANAAAVPQALLAEAQYRYARLFEAGRGSAQSDTAARTWYERAANLGHRGAMLAFADMLDKTAGEGYDPQTADKWRELAGATKPAPAPPLPSRPLTLGAYAAPVAPPQAAPATPQAAPRTAPLDGGPRLIPPRNERPSVMLPAPTPLD